MSSAPTVLCVDDDAAIRDMVAMVLADSGYEVATARNGAEALRWVEEHTPSLILLDLGMPVMDGATFAKAYRHAPLRHAPIVIITAAREARTVAASLGATDVLPKPFDLEVLLDTVRRYIG